MNLDQRGVQALTEQSQDLHSDAMQQTRNALSEIVDLGHEQRTRGAGPDVDVDRRSLLRKSLFAAGVIGAGFGAGFLRNSWTTVFAAGTDVDALQTSAAIENLAIKVYQTAAGLPPSVSGASNPVILAFVKTTIAQHMDHANAFNAAIQQLGGKEQMGLDTTVYNGVVSPALPKIKGPSDVLALAITLEDAAAQSYISYATNASNANAIKTWASIAPVEAQHVAVLTAVKALVDGGAPQLITLPPNLAALPMAAGSIGFPHSFYPITNARPSSEATVS